jgi:MarR family transcriptional regulator, organic hydroperoxide resistance regulator
MGRGPNNSPASPSRRNKNDSTVLSASNQDAARLFTWEIAAISVHLQEIRYFWAKALGVSGPQWMILMAIADHDRGEGISVKDVAKILHVDPSFVTTQSKLLEKKAFVRRTVSHEDARVVQMTLTDKSQKYVAGLVAQQEELNRYIFAEFSGGELNTFTAKLASLKGRLEKARAKVMIGI